MRLSLLALAMVLGCNGDKEAPPSLSLSPENLDFGEVPVGSTETLTFTASNAGDGEIEVLSVNLVEGDTDPFSLDREGSLRLAGGLTLDVAVSFTPESEEDARALVQLRYDDGEVGSITVELLGQGAPSVTDADADGYTPADGDCNDSEATVHPGADELCDGRDTDCDGSTPADEADSDGDGYRGCSGDCDDGDRRVHPGADEICDDKDSDCDGEESDRIDNDGDGFAICDGDCDDAEPDVSPGLPEICDGLDNDCSEEIDDLDADNDGHSLCSLAGDCDDNNPDAYPVVVDASFTGSSEGTDAAPFTEVGEAMAAIDATCRTVWIADGTYTVSEAYSLGPITLRGESEAGVVLTPPAGQRVFELSNSAPMLLQTLTVAGADVTGDGGAISVSQATLVLQQVTLRDNAASGDGGAVAVTSGSITSSYVTFSGNTAADDGGAVSLLSSVMADNGSTWSGNSGVRGGAIVADGASLSNFDSTFLDNEASGDGGAIAMIGGSFVYIVANTFGLNTAGGDGGALSFTDVNLPTGVVASNIVIDNSATGNGGGIAVKGSNASFNLNNNTIVANAGGGEGAGLCVAAPGALGVRGNLIGWSDGLSGAYLSEISGHLVAYNTAYFTNSGVDFAGVLSEGADGNLSENPLFVNFQDNRDPTDDDLHLAGGSGARDSGPPESAYNDRDGTRNDRGYTGGPHAN